MYEFEKVTKNTSVASTRQSYAHICKSGIFFSHFSPNSSQSKLKKFAKLKVFNLNSTVFLKFPHENLMIFS